MFGTLSSISRENASILRSSVPVVCRQPRRSKTVFSGWNASGMNARKPPVSVLLVAQPEDVVDPLLVRLDVAVEHRAVRRDPEPVRGVVDVEPDLRALLAGRHEPAHAVGEDLGAAARERAQPGVLELAQHLLVREPGERRHVVDLGGRVALEVHVRERLVQRRDRVAVVAEVRRAGSRR